MLKHRENQTNRIDLQSNISLMTGLLTMLCFLTLIVLDQFFSQVLERFGAYIFLSIPILGIIGLIAGLAAFIKIREGSENPRAQKYSMIGIFLSLITLTIFLLVFWLL